MKPNLLMIGFVATALACAPISPPNEHSDTLPTDQLNSLETNDDATTRRNDASGDAALALDASVGDALVSDVSASDALASDALANDALAGDASANDVANTDTEVDGSTDTTVVVPDAGPDSDAEGKGG